MCENAYAAGIGTPDVVKATCPVWGALGGIPLPQDSMDAVLRLHWYAIGTSTTLESNKSLHTLSEQLCQK